MLRAACSLLCVVCWCVFVVCCLLLFVAYCLLVCVVGCWLLIGVRCTLLGASGVLLTCEWWLLLVVPCVLS